MLLCAGCRSILGIEEPIAGTPPDVIGRDGGLDDGVPTIDGCTSFSRLLDTCAIGQYGSALAITGVVTYNTATHEFSNGLTAPAADVLIGGQPMTVLLVDGFTIDGISTLRVIGSRAFGIVSTAPVHIIGTIDASVGGAGARTKLQCAVGAGADGLDNMAASSGGSGGGGGALRGSGGRGGKGDLNGAGLLGGVAGSPIVLGPAIVGGCPGGKGGAQVTSGAGGAAGPGGGAVFVVSAASIDVTGVVNVGGGGGGAGKPMDGGGGGGGSGGTIVLESSTVAVTGTLAANGGGGGVGAGNNQGTDGDPGAPQSTGANGGNPGGAGGGPGGNGGAGSQLAGSQAGDGTAGGGGGGGGVGFTSLISASPTITGVVSPAPTPFP